jgi:hypothetical protein
VQTIVDQIRREAELLIHLAEAAGSEEERTRLSACSQAMRAWALEIGRGLIETPSELILQATAICATDEGTP